MKFTNEELVLKIQAGEREYLEVLWEQIKGLIYRRAQWYNFILERYHFVDVDDFVQCGYFAMLDGVERFDPSKNMKFSSYIFFWYKSEIYRAVVGKRVNKLPPTTTSLNTAIDDESIQTELINLIPDFSMELEKRIEDKELREAVRKAVNKLEEVEARVIHLAYFQDLSIAEISSKLHLHEVDVALHKRRAIRKLGGVKEINQIFDTYFG